MKIIILCISLFLTGCISAEAENETTTLTAESENWSGLIEVEHIEHDDDVIESADMNLFYNGDARGNFSYTCLPEWLNGTHIIREAELPEKEQPFTENFVNYQFTEGYADGKTFIIKVEWEEDESSKQEKLAFS
ncbi:hypothetical protein [Alkalicoccus halolimnae]|uniref:Lipoprotein n=1 Tax=Alkalicoccus halolimnae TaxID=1667239 RepID=A0A5C7FG53_9BACI|nr:hypothetical protein [Alkalicoccus halolimnae]TXF85169.1 hypothetical protein FTX54_10145 [Alkalicoccus halolimnae]